MKRNPSYSNDELLTAVAARSLEEPHYSTELDDDTVYLPAVRSTSYAINPVLLCSALFGITAKRVKDDDSGKVQFVREYIERTFPTTNGASVKYQGKRLCQDDLTVLLGLLHRLAGMNVALEIEFAPSSFCTEIGWSDSEYNVLRLKDCMLRLRQALLTIESTSVSKDDSEKSKLALAIGAGWTMNFLQEFAWDGLSRWKAQLDPRVAQLFKSTPTYLIISRRQALAEGLQTWLYGYIEANSCHYAVDLKVLYEHCGSSAPLKEFARQVRDAIPKLASARVITADSCVKNGKVAFFKAQRKPAK